MTSPAKTYQKEMHRNLGFFATWLPGDSLALGNVGVLSEGRFVTKSSLQDLGIKFKKDRPGSAQTLQYTSASGTAIKTSASADAANVADAEISVEFSSNGAFLFHATGVQQIRIADRSDMGRAILAAYRRREWREEWWIVESLYKADCATVMVSQGKSSAIVLRATADAPLGVLPLASPAVNLSIEATRGNVLHVVAGRRLTPLYACLRVRNPLFGSPRMEPVRGLDDGSEVSFDRASIDELLES